MKGFLTILLCCIAIGTFAQKNVADSFSLLIVKEKSDTSKAKLLLRKAIALSNYAPDEALTVAKQSYELSNKVKFESGESKALSQMANILVAMGNYPAALAYNLRGLKIEEKRNSPIDLASVLLNTGVVYSFQEQYDKALFYYYKADSIISIISNKSFLHSIKLNIGDAYDKQNKLDSSFKYFNQSVILARELKSSLRMGASLIGLAHTYRKEKNYPLGETYYKMGIENLKVSDAQDLLCESYIGFAKLSLGQGNNNKAKRYADTCYGIAKAAGFIPRELEAASFLTELYKSENKTDSALFYLNKTVALNETVNSSERIRQMQILSSSENIRQIEMAETKARQKKERKTQLGLLFIGMFIPVFFIFTLLLSKISMNLKVLKSLGVLSLLFLFEYLTLLFHPFVANLTNHNPFLEMIIFVIAALFLIPAHHRLEKWLIRWLQRNRRQEKGIKLQIKKIKVLSR